MQDRDLKATDEAELKVVTHRAPTAEEKQAMQFGWRVVKHVKSNAVIYVGPDRTLGIGAGQMSRVDSVRLAVEKCREARGPDAEAELTGSSIASDAFFPFADGPQAAIEAGSTAVIQPGGSKRDREVIEACDAAGVAMVFTKHRHFRH